MYWFDGHIDSRPLENAVEKFVEDLNYVAGRGEDYVSWFGTMHEVLLDWIRRHMRDGYLYKVMAETDMDPFLDAIRDSDNPRLPENGEQFFYRALESLVDECVTWEEDEDVSESRRSRRGCSLAESRRLSPLRRRNQGIRR